MTENLLRFLELVRWPLVAAFVAGFVLDMLEDWINARRRWAMDLREYKKQLDDIHHQIEITHHVTERLEAAERQVKAMTDRMTVLDNRTAGLKPGGYRSP